MTALDQYQLTCFCFLVRRALLPEATALPKNNTHPNSLSFCLPAASVRAATAPTVAACCILAPHNPPRVRTHLQQPNLPSLPQGVVAVQNICSSGLTGRPHSPLRKKFNFISSVIISGLWFVLHVAFVMVRVRGVIVWPAPDNNAFG